MRYSKALCLALCAVMAATMLAAAAPASAARLCEENKPKCEGKNYKTGQALEARLEGGKFAVFKAGKFNEKGEFEQAFEVVCNESVINAKATNEGGGTGTPVLTEVTGVTFGWTGTANCPANGGLKTCTVTTLGLPYQGSVEFAAGNNGTWSIVEKGGGGQPRAELSCLGKTVVCFYGKNILEMSILGGMTWFPTVNQKLEKGAGSSGVCPAVAFYIAEYEGLKPGKMWITDE